MTEPAIHTTETVRVYRKDDAGILAEKFAESLERLGVWATLLNPDAEECQEWELKSDVPWLAAEVERLRVALAEIADLPSVRQDESPTIACRALVESYRATAAAPRAGTPAPIPTGPMPRTVRVSAGDGPADIAERFATILNALGVRTTLLSTSAEEAQVWLVNPLPPLPSPYVRVGRQAPDLKDPFPEG